MANVINIKNKKVYHNFEVEDKLVAGIQLTGTEIKSIRLGKASLIDTYCFFLKTELWLKGMHISEYSWGSYNNHEPKRDRKLLLNRRELNKLERKVKEKGYTIVATRLFVNKEGYAKVEVGLAKGKQSHDKREDMKQKDAKREMDRVKKKY